MASFEQEFSAEDTAWYLAQIKPQAYRIAERNLHRQKIQTFLPVHSVTRKERGRFVTRDVPLFPGYMFVAFDITSGALRRVNATLGVNRIVTVGDTPADIPRHVVEGLRQRCDDSGRLEVPETPSIGEEVTLVTGPFADFVATVEKLDPDQRIWVLIDLLGRKTRLAIDGDAWRPT